MPHSKSILFFRFSFFHPICSIFIHFITHSEYSLISFIYHKAYIHLKNQSAAFSSSFFSLFLCHFPAVCCFCSLCAANTQNQFIFFFYLSLSFYQQNLFRTFFVVFCHKISRMNLHLFSFITKRYLFIII